MKKEIENILNRIRKLIRKLEENDFLYYASNVRFISDSIKEDVRNKSKNINLKNVNSVIASYEKFIKTISTSFLTSIKNHNGHKYKKETQHALDVFRWKGYLDNDTRDNACVIFRINGTVSVAYGKNGEDQTHTEILNEYYQTEIFKTQYRDEIPKDEDVIFGNEYGGILYFENENRNAIFNNKELKELTRIQLNKNNPIFEYRFDYKTPNTIVEIRKLEPNNSWK